MGFYYYSVYIIDMLEFCSVEMCLFYEKKRCSVACNGKGRQGEVILEDWTKYLLEREEQEGEQVCLFVPKNFLAQKFLLQTQSWCRKNIVLPAGILPASKSQGSILL